MHLAARRSTARRASSWASLAGLSCATFVNVVFQAAKVKLVNEETWASQRTQERAAQDREAKKRVAEFLAQSPEEADRDQSRRVASELDSPRLRAEEIAAASSQKTRPLDLLTAEPLGKQVLAEMASLSQESPPTPPPPKQLVAEAVSAKAGLQTQ